MDVILDSVGAPYFQRNLESLNLDGRLFIIGTMGGAVTQLDIRSLFAKRLTVQGKIILNEVCWYKFQSIQRSFSSFYLNQKLVLEFQISWN